MIYLCRKGQVYLVSPSGVGNHRSSTRHGTNIVTVATTNSSFCQEVERLDGWSSLHYVWPYFLSCFIHVVHSMTDFRVSQVSMLPFPRKLKTLSKPLAKEKKTRIMNNGRSWKDFFLPTVVTQACFKLFGLSDVLFGRYFKAGR